MEQKPLTIAIVGCGNIARAYGKSLQPYPQLKLLGATDYMLKLAEDYAATFGGKVYPSLEDILADEEVDLVINLTIHKAHVEVITKCLHAGKDVFSEKPIALTSEEAWRLVELAKEKGCRLSKSLIRARRKMILTEASNGAVACWIWPGPCRRTVHNGSPVRRPPMLSIIVRAIQTASGEGCRVQITSEFPQPAPMEWAK